jgi:3-oxoacyl-[acyl-carrier protein] reductase
LILKGRITLITGASRGIGAATAELLASRGAIVAASARTIPDLEQLVVGIKEKGGEALVVPCDVVRSEQVETMIDRVQKEYGRLDILINNAGMGIPSTPVEDILPAEWDRVLAINLKSAFLCIRAAAPLMKRQGYGRIVNVSSPAGRTYSPFRGSPYTAAKAGLLGLTRQMAAELGPYGICVNALAPYLVLTERAKALWNSFTEEKRQGIIAGIPLRRLARIEEIASAIAFLASDDASFVNGVCLDVNGGSTMI